MDLPIFHCPPKRCFFFGILISLCLTALYLYTSANFWSSLAASAAFSKSDQKLYDSKDERKTETLMLTSQATPRNVKPEKRGNFREKFFDWQDKKTALESVFGADHVIDTNKYLIYRCDTQNLCGGWANRVRGIIAAYIIANLTGRVFKVELLSPLCDISEILIPNMVNWSLPTPFHKVLNDNLPGVKVFNIIDNKAFTYQFQTTNFTEWIHPSINYAYLKANRLGLDAFRNSKIYQQQLSWMKNYTNGDIVGIIFKHLFRLSNRLNKNMKAYLEKLLPTPEHQLICTQVRMGQNPSNPNDARISTKNDLPSYWNFLKNKSISDLQPIFVMSDSAEVIEEAKKQTFGHRIFSTPGAIVHVDRFSYVPKKDLCAGLEKVIFDQHVLVNCDALLVGRGGLSHTSAALRGTTQGLYCLQKGYATPCNMDCLSSLDE